MKAYLQQRQHITALKAQIVQSESDIDTLEREKSRWHDPAYVQSQARARFGYLMPGETSYVVLGADGKPLESQTVAARQEGRHRQAADGLVDTAWQSVLLAGDPPAPEDKPDPLAKIGPPTQQVIDPADEQAVPPSSAGRPRAIHAVGHRCPCGQPDVVTTEPRLPDGTPFPTTYYLTCPRAASLIGTLEGSGLMKEMEARLASDEELAAAYAAAHRAYLADRSALAEQPGERAGDRGHLRGRHADPGQVPARPGRARLAAGPGVNPLGDEVLRAARGVVGWRARVSEVAAFDCGTNTIKLLVGDLPEVSVRETRIVRLGQGVDATGRLADEALVRAFAAIDEYAAILADHDVSRVRFCATSATRDSANAAIFARGGARPARRLAGGAVGGRGGGAVLRRGDPQPAHRSRPHRCWSSTSAADRPS